MLNKIFLSIFNIFAAMVLEAALTRMGDLEGAKKAEDTAETETVELLEEVIKDVPANEFLKGMLANPILLKGIAKNLNDLVEKFALQVELLVTAKLQGQI